MTYKEFKKVNKHNAEIFMQAMWLQSQRIAMPDITPTNFGMSVYKRILENIIQSQSKTKTK